SRRRHTRSKRDWSSDVCSSDLTGATWLIPALPISVAPKGTPARPAVDDEGRGDEGMLLSVHDSGALPEIPPPSNGAFDDGAALEIGRAACRERVQSTLLVCNLT